jgi:hypothetical protein
VLSRLDELTLLGAGLRGGRWSEVAVPPFTESSIDPDSGASDVAVLAFPLDFERREIGSRVTTRALGAGKVEISMFSSKLIRLRHETVGFIVVGFVRVDVSI